MEVAIRRTEVRSEEISGATAHSQEGAVPPKTGFHDAFVPLVPRESGTGVTRYPAGAQNLAARILCRERSSTTAKGAPSGSSRSLLGALAAADSRTLAPQFRRVKALVCFCLYSCWNWACRKRSAWNSPGGWRQKDTR